jgi:putative tryptophan/tyrosine transport system substrate-binding protein
VKLGVKATGFALAALTISFGSVEAQQSIKVPKVGFLHSASAASVSARREALQEGLRDLGYAEGRNIIIEYRYGEGDIDRLRLAADNLVKSDVDILVTGAALATSIAKSATRRIPIVMAAVSDPVKLGFVSSLARPGGNITGLSTLSPEISGKRLELLKEIVPGLARVAVIGDQRDRDSARSLEETEVAARALGVKHHVIELRGAEGIENAFKQLPKQRLDAVLLLPGTLNSHRNDIIRRALISRIPVIYYAPEWADDGGLMSYGVSFPELYRRAATYVDKILKGAKPADLPVEQPTKFELVINLKTAKQIGVTIPPNVLARADRVIK